MRLFLGFTPTLAQRQIYSLCERLEFPESLPLRWVPPENWHVTLVFLGDVPERALGRIDAAVAPILQDRAPLPTSLEALEWFPSPLKPRMLTLRVEATPELVSLQAEVAAALRREGFHSEHRSYRPHITLARLKGSRKLIEPPPLLPITPIPEELSELVLFESHKRERRYIPLQRFGMAA
jgi:2'-5' RNA ligase